MSRIKLTIIFSNIAVITLALIIIGFLFDKTDAEKLNGLTDVFDVSINGTIAYVSYNEGKPEIYLKTDSEEKLALQLDVDKTISDIAFSPNGTSLAYVISGKDLEESIHSSLHTLDVRSLDSKQVFQDETLITEIEFDPKDEHVLFYLGANTFENYSPVARAYPHDIDIYSYHMEEEKHTRYTEMETYSMQSLNVSFTEDVVYVQMNDDAHAETAEDMFETKQKIFQVPLDQPEKLSVISDQEREIDIYDFTLVPNQQAMIFQSISNANAGGTFEYELYYYDWEKNEEVKLTDLQEYTDRPVITDSGKKVFFIVDKKFGVSQYPDYFLYEMDIDGNNVTEVYLDNK